MSRVLLTCRMWLFVCVSCVSLLVVADDVAVPALTQRVTDMTGTLSGEQQQSLEHILQDFEVRKGTQIAVLMVSSTAPETIEQYSLRVVERWKIGRKSIDDGALLLIAKDDRTLRIEVGYGLEGVLNDAICRRIISEVIAPQFKQGRYYTGVQAGVERMIRVVDGEPLPPPVATSNASVETFMSIAPVLLVAALIGGGLLRQLFGSLWGALLTGGIIGLMAWLMTSLLLIALIAGLAAAFFTLMGLPMGIAGFYRGGKGGSFGDGGFGGGGGGFGGGGASGRW